MGKLQFFFSVSNDECTAAHWERVWDHSTTKKNATISARETNRTKKSMFTTAQTYWQSSAEIWEGQRNYSLKNEVDMDAISCFSIRKDWRFAVRAKSFALHWRSRGFFRGHVRSCEKGLWYTLVDLNLHVLPNAIDRARSVKRLVSSTNKDCYAPCDHVPSASTLSALKKGLVANLSTKRQLSVH